MKKKVFSKLLMVALVATVGVFSSCKDYDDDIADVNGRITQTATELRQDYTNKVSAVEAAIGKLQTQYDQLTDAYTKADAALKATLETTISDNLAVAKAYTDAAKGEALSAAAAAEKAAKDYADVQRAEAEKAALAAAKEQVAAAKQELADALAKANETIAKQGTTIETLLTSVQTLETAITTAQARANEAYALADKANTLAEQNKSNLEKAVSDIATLQTELANLKGSAASAADVATLQSELAALQKQVNENVVNLADYKENITKVTSDLATLKEDLAKQVGTLGDNINAVKAIADANVAKIEGIQTQLAELKEANTQAHEQIIASVNALAAVVETNKNDAATALSGAIQGVEAKLANAVQGIEAELAAANKLIKSNDDAIRALVDTKASELKALIDGNTSAISALSQTVEKNADAQAAENVLMNNAIAKNAQDIVAQGKDITSLEKAVDALKTALGDDTAATLKEYAASIAKSEALQAKLDAQGYSDAQDAAQNITIMAAIADQAKQDKAAWEAAINTAVDALVKTYQLNALAETIKNAQLDAEANSKTYTDGQVADALTKAQTMSDKALADAKHYTDDLKTFLTSNYTNTTDMNAAIEAAKQSAIAQAYKNVMDALLADNTDWTKDGKVITIAEEVAKQLKAFAEAAGYTNADAAKQIAEDAIAAALIPSAEAEIGKPAVEAGPIMAAIEAAAKVAADELAAVNSALDARLDVIEGFLNNTAEDGNTFNASVNALIAAANLASAADLTALQNQVNGYKVPEMQTALNGVVEQAAQNAADVQKIQTTINNINAMFTGLFGASEATSNVDDAALQTFEDNIQALVDRIKAMGDVVDNLDEKVMESVNKNLGPQIQTMITSINLYANIHQATSDTYYGENKGDVDGTKPYQGYMGLDHELKFTYTVELGKPGKDVWSYPEDYEMRGDYELGEDVEGVQFEKGMFRTYEDAILVRVSPVNADLAAVKDQIALINSNGNNIVADGIVEVTDVQRFEESGYGPITRAYGDNKINTGLWIIKFKLVEGKIATDFNKAAFVTADKAGDYKKQIVYAVAVKNTNFGTETDEEGNAVDDGIDRYIVSEFDLTLAQAGVSNSYDFYVNDTPIAEIHNRYVRTDEAETGGTNWSDDIDEYPGKFSYELTWNTLGCYNWAEAMKNDAAIDDPDKRQLIYDYYCCAECDNQDDNDKVCTPNLGATYVNWKHDLKLGECDENVNAVDRAGHSITDGTRNTSGIDNRHEKPILEVSETVDAADEEALKDEEGKWFKVKIDFDDTNECDEYTKIKAFYVTLDEDFSKESGTSEINAWTSYIYKNVAYYYVNGMQPIAADSRVQKWVKSKTGQTITLQEGNHGVIYIKDANNVRGDIIGFRVHAVNVDGTFTDPDGRAFYVRFGKETIEHNLTFNIYPEDQDADALAVQDGNPIYDFNKDPENIDMRFFNVPVYDDGFIPSEEYEYVYTWRGESNIIRGYGDNSTNAYFSVDGTEYKFTNTAGDELIEKNLATADDMKKYFSPESFFTFSFSKNPNATVEDNEANDWKVQTNTPIWPNRTVNSMRLTAKAKTNGKNNFNRLIDGATYKILLTIYRKDKTTQSSTIYNKINIDIIKNMPTESGLTLKSGQDDVLSGGVWKFYVRPLVNADLARVAATQDGGNARRFDAEAGSGAQPRVAADPWQITWNAFAPDFATDYDAEGEEIATNQHLYRWAADVRPWTLDEMFNGIIYNKYEYKEDGTVNTVTPTVSKDFYFIFKGAGDFASAHNKLGTFAEKDNYSTEAVYDEAYKDADATVVYNANTAEDVTATPTGNANNIIGYRMPYVHYSHIGDGKTYDVLGGRIFRGISANLAADGKSFLAPKDKQENTEGLLTAIANEDFKLDAKAIQTYDKQNTLKAQYLCAIDNELNFPTAAQGTVKDCKYNEQKGIDIFGTTVTAGAAAMYNKFAPKATNYAETLFPAAWSTLPKLADLISGEKPYYKVDYSSLQIVLPSNAPYDINEWFDIYFAANETDGLEKKIDPSDAENNSKIKYLVVKPSRDGIRPALDKDYDNIQVKFNIYDVWHHGPKTIQIKGLKILKPTEQASRQVR